ncbi:hypothetical protein M409DRAFT_50499 [Zasmidium cellare ATCC 36951]|uniref:Chromo domain-containing protein n=1 Tax=Zasmidium cellare ATCC 36951 TaxID=1080233 RepID=A0A6A6D095_ZASCE|nr:uncharacterized protein M409DRAFT_50499 [Zasmidium cellare ATCC 36951]KAF2171880.1 hypothetical protein M409DRAFT_50499 [Zasmidium cellare ATCC 36951]
MPPLLTSDIEKPVDRSPHRMVPVIKVPPHPPVSKPAPQPRTYSDEPLPVRPSDHAPRKAAIKERIALPDRVAYTLDIGGVEIEDVGIHEVLDYVSAYDLETFEHRQFEEEREIMRIANLEQEAERERRKQRAKTKGQVIYQTDSGTVSQEDEDVETGKHGRARPTYKHLFKAPEMRQRKRRRKRDPFTGELMPLSDEEDAAFNAPAKATAASSRAPAPATELPKRRRRKRNKITGELLPLSPDGETAQPSIEKGKRPRRRRHPITGELMPLGWRYDPNTEQQSYEQRRDGAGAHSTPSIKRLSITREHDAKRMKLTSEEPSSDDELGTRQPVVQSRGKLGIFASDDSRESSSSRDPPPMSSSKSRPAPKTSIMNPVSQRISRLGPPPSATDSSSEPKITLASFLKPNQPEEDDESSDDSSSLPKQKVNTPGERGKTSIMNPMAAQTVEESDDAEDEELEEGEWFVEAILGHHLSDPRTHPGKKQVMLYKTKWEGWNNPTWEPEDSFVDQGVLEDYRQRAGLNGAKTQIVAGSKKKSVTPAPKPKATAVNDESDDESDEEEGYEVESILGHHMSDPRTHPGKPATMLYKVKWLGWPEPTWEPRRSFTDKTIVRKYEKRVGLKPERSEDSNGDMRMKT